MRLSLRRPDDSEASLPSDWLTLPPRDSARAERQARDWPSYLLTAGLALFFTVSLRFPSYARSAIDWDESLYLLIAERWLNGGLPYVELWDHKPPGLYVAFELALVVFGRSAAAPRFLVSLLIAASAWLIYWLLRKVQGARAGAGSVLLLYPAYTLTMGGLSANAEHFFIFFNLLGLACLVRALEMLKSKESVLTLLGAGLSFGLALQFKYLALFESAYFVGCFVAYQLHFRKVSVRQLLAPLALLAAAMVLPTALAFAYFAMHGAADEFIYANFTANARHATAEQPALDLFITWFKKTCPWLRVSAPLWVACVLGARLAQRSEHSSPRRLQLFLLGWVVVGIIEAAATKRFYGHYYLVTIAPLCALTAVAIGRLARHHRTGRTLLIAALLAMFPLTSVARTNYLPWRAERDGDEPEQLTRILQASMTPADTLHVLDDQPILYFLSQARPVSRYVFPLQLMTEHFSAVAGVNYRDEFASIIARNPRCVVLRKQQSERSREFRKLLSSNYLSRNSTPHAEVLCR